MRIKEVFNTKNKKIIAGSIALGMIIIGTGAVYALTRSKPELLILKKDEIIVEYGQSISTDPKDYLNTKGLDSEDKKKVLENTKFKADIKNEIVTTINEDGTKTESDAGYAQIGNYKIILTYEDETKNVMVKVKDTTAPELTIPESIEMVQGTNLSTYDFKSLMTATDLAQLNDIQIDYSSIDVNIPGEYTAKASVEDVNKNKTEKEFKVTVVASSADSNTETTTEVVTDPATGQKKSVVTTKPKQNTTTNSSSSSSSSNNSSNSSSGKPSGSSPSTSKPSGGSSTSGSNGGTTNKPSKPSDNNSSSGGNAGSSSGNSSGSIQFIVKYTCNEHGGEYDSLEELMAAGHYNLDDERYNCNSYSMYSVGVYK